MTFGRGKDPEAKISVVPFQRQLISPYRAFCVANKEPGFYAVFHKNRSSALESSLLEVAEM